MIIYEEIFIHKWKKGYIFSMVPKNRTKSREKNLNIHGKILNWSKISFFEVRSTVYAPNRHKKPFKV